ncbi:hypothetical protein DUI87_19081 [Hirundo rustica rustica]|uniref:Reverse transcriptase domain-containing protein n=1 Tax=Hirundo rustica rustica TaxID=333673 RepID=A0A3M0JTD4_HIRRU|nr:hypothetical protein DUI87_19081 [Hirundo rustica rustica]
MNLLMTQRSTPDRPHLGYCIQLWGFQDKDVDLLKAIELQVKKEGAQEQVLEEMALANANEQYKAAILSLSMELAPTLDDMLQKETKDNVGMFLNEQGTLATEDTEKGEVLNAFFASIFTNKTSPQGSLTQETRVKEWWEEDIPLVKEDWVREHLSKLDIQKSVGPEGIHPEVLKALADIIGRPLMIIFERLWRSGEVPEDWKKANVTLVFKKGMKEDPGNYCPVSLTSVPGKVMECLIL